MPLPDLTQDEEAVLLIAHEGAWLAPIGRWETSVKNLALKGLLYRKDDVNYGITGAGRDAVTELERRTDEALGQLITRGNQMGAAQKQCRDIVEQAAHLLVQCADASTKIMGQSPEHALREWSRVLLERSLELQKNKAR